MGQGQSFLSNISNQDVCQINNQMSDCLSHLALFSIFTDDRKKKKFLEISVFG